MTHSKIQVTRMFVDEFLVQAIDYGVPVVLQNQKYKASVFFFSCQDHADMWFAFGISDTVSFDVVEKMIAHSGGRERMEALIGMFGITWEVAESVDYGPRFAEQQVITDRHIGEEIVADMIKMSPDALAFFREQGENIGDEIEKQ